MQRDLPVEAVFRAELPRVIGALARLTGDVALAEDMAQEAVLAALEQWPADGLPGNPGAWLTTTAKRRALDHFRRASRQHDKYGELARQHAEVIEVDFDAGLGPPLHRDIDDDLLRLLFVSCHPVLSAPARSALTLRLLGGLTTAEIARAYLVPEPTMAARITRAKKALTAAGVPFEVPTGPDRAARLDSVLHVLYLMFNEGYAATAGGAWVRVDLTLEALRLSRVLAGLLPAEPEVLALQSLLEIQASRNDARTAADGSPILLADQQRSRWDQLKTRRGLLALDRARELSAADGWYLLQAELAACHARAARFADTDWSRIAALYGRLARFRPSPVVELNRAVAVSFADGPAAALPLLDPLEEPLGRYHLLPSVRGDLLERLGRRIEAAVEFDRAAALAGNERERRLLTDRAAAARSTVRD